MLRQKMLLIEHLDEEHFYIYHSTIYDKNREVTGT